MQIRPWVAEKCTGVTLTALPFDLGGNPGASLGALRIAEVFRRKFCVLNTHAAPPRWATWGRGSAMVDAHPYRFHHTYTQWASELGARVVSHLRMGRFPVLVGGNHIALASAYDALDSEIPGLHIVSFDAHFDLGGSVPAEEPSHGDFWESLLKPALLRRLVWVGPRHAPPERYTAVRWVDAAAVQFTPPRSVVTKLGLDGVPLVLDIDLDVLDAAVFPATVSRMPGGPGYLEVVRVIQEIAHRCDVRAVGLSEYNPLLDDSLTTSLNTATELMVCILNCILPARPCVLPSGPPGLKAKHQVRCPSE